jgi:hypothetical protein
MTVMGTNIHLGMGCTRQLQQELDGQQDTPLN